MLISRTLKIIETHTAGNPTRHILAGLPRIPGNTMAEKMQYMHDHMDWVRRMTMMEPRGGGCMSGTIYTQPCDPEADMGILYFDTTDYMTMCGHSTIAVATVLVETGVVPMVEPVTTVKLDTPAGLVTAWVQCENHCVKSVTFQNVPSFLYGAKTVQIPEFGEVYVEVAFGGMAYAIVDAAQLGVQIRPDQAAELRRVSHILYKAIAEQIGFRHPTQPFIDRIHSIMLYDKPTAPDANCKEVVVLIPPEEGNATGIDRSPCGTGTSAKLAYMYSTGRLKMGEQFVNGNFTGAIFKGHVKEEAMVGDYPAIIPVITGSAYISGIATYLIDPTDPLKWGFVI